MYCYKDQTFCSQPNCRNECDRKLWEKDLETARRLEMPIAQQEFCNDKGELKNDHR